MMSVGGMLRYIQELAHRFEVVKYNRSRRLRLDQDVVPVAVTLMLRPSS